METAPAAPSATKVGSTSGRGGPGDGPDLDGGHVVEYPAAVGEAGRVASDQTEVGRAVTVSGARPR